MGLDLTIKPLKATSLGDSEQVRTRLLDAFPGITFGREPSGREQIERARAMGYGFPQAMQEALRDIPESQTAIFENEKFTIQFYWTDAPAVPLLNADARFSGLHEKELCKYLARLRGCETLLHDTGRTIRGR